LAEQPANINLNLAMNLGLTYLCLLRLQKPIINIDVNLYLDICKEKLDLEPNQGICFDLEIY
jgi:hypothetical protein